LGIGRVKNIVVPSLAIGCWAIRHNNGGALVSKRTVTISKRRLVFYQRHYNYKDVTNLLQMLFVNAIESRDARWLKTRRGRAE